MLFRSGEWPAAVTNYTIVSHLLPGDHYAYHYLGPLLLQAGDIEGYRRHCARMLSQFGQTADPVIAERTAKDCLILPPPEADLASIAKLAETAVSAGPSHKFFRPFQFVKGLAEFRQNRFASAVEWLKPVLAQEGDVYCTVQAQMTLAMAEQQLKQPEQARAALTKGVEIAEAGLPKLNKDSSPEDRMNDWIIAHLLMREAKTLIEQTSVR